MYCIQETDKPNLFFKIFNIVQLIDNKIILPVPEDEYITAKRAEKLANKTKKVLDKTISKRIIVSKKLQKQEQYMKLLKDNNFEIIDGTWLFEVLSCKILDYIINKKKMKKEETSISILVNDLNENIISIIRQIAKEYKRVNIVTNYLEKFKRIESQIYEKDGIMITVGNNKKKGIANSPIVLNVDFSSEAISNYNIFDGAIIVNIRKKCIIKSKRFNGVTINNYDVSFYDLDDCGSNMDKYRACELLEGHLNKKQPYSDVIKDLDRYKVQITKLYGKNGTY